jgi:leader peptidase (prepilin peptidase)/N-methyltransferase
MTFNLRFADEGLDLCFRTISILRPPEFIAAIASLSIAFAAPAAVLPDSSWWFGALFGTLTIIIALIDAHFFRIPDLLTIGIFALGLASGVAAAPDDIGYVLGSAFVRAGSFAALFLVLRTSYRLVRKREGLGLGDVKLAAAAGAWLSWYAMLTSIEIAAASALLLFFIREVLVGKPVRLNTRLPFGLFFAPAIWIAWLFSFVQWPLLGGW